MSEPNHPNAAHDTPDPIRGEELEAPVSEEVIDLSAVQSDLEKFKDLALRAQADFENYRKRATRERDEAVRYANAGLLEDLLPVIDNFELGLDAARQQDPDSPILIGMSMVQKQLNDFLVAQNVEVIAANPGDPFDPNTHEALGQEENPSIPEGHILRQVRRGYRLRDRLLRPASVFVSKGNPA